MHLVLADVGLIIIDDDFGGMCKHSRKTWTLFDDTRKRKVTRRRSASARREQELADSWRSSHPRLGMYIHNVTGAQDAQYLLRQASSEFAVF